MKVLVLGSGCTKCKMLADRVQQIASANQLTVEVEKVTELHEIMKYRILTTPGLVIDGIVKSAGYIPKDEQILTWLKGI
jgi:small redox-active disulfide protein 2